MHPIRWTMRRRVDGARTCSRGATRAVPSKSGSSRAAFAATSANVRRRARKPADPSRLFTVLHDGVPVAITRAVAGAEACARVDSVLAVDDARAILARAGLAPSAVVGAALGGASIGCRTRAARDATADE